MTSKPLKHTPDGAESPAQHSAEETAGSQDLEQSEKRPGEQVSGKDADGSGPAEIGGREGPDPTRYGDWEKNGRCIDF